MAPGHHIVILGGGVIGLSCAHSLLGEGHAVTILEIGETGRRCSLHNAGLVVPSHVVPLASPGIIARGIAWMLRSESPFHVRPRPSLSLLRWGWLFRRSAGSSRAARGMVALRDLFAAGSGMFEELSMREGMSFGLERRGILMLYRTDEGREACEHEAGLAREMGVSCASLDRTELAALQPGVPFRATGAIHYPDDAHLSPSLFVERLTSLVLRQGARIRRSVPFVRWEQGGSGVAAVHTGEGTFRADTFILAAGAWSGLLARRLGLRLPLEAGKGYSLTLPAAEWRGTIPLLLIEDRVAVTPLNGAVRYAGTMELAGIDERISERRLRAIARAVPRYLDIPEPPPGGERWAGLRPCTPDGLPYIGRFRRVPNLIAATGHAMLGLTLAPVTGAIVSDIVARRMPRVDLTALSPDRFAGG